MIVQVSNIGYDVKGDHSFDIMIPGGGQGLFQGCPKYFPGTSNDDADCGTRYGGCDAKHECGKLPSKLRKGCMWRFDWLKASNPYVDFRRVQCPKQLTRLSGTVPNDDSGFPKPDMRLSNQGGGNGKGKGKGK